MVKKCKKCGVPLEGFGYRWIAKPIFRIKHSEKDSELCKKNSNHPTLKCGAFTFEFLDSKVALKSGALDPATLE